MAINLLVEASDPDVERLLEYLHKMENLSLSSKILLLENTLVWLKASDNFRYPNKAYAITLKTDHMEERQVLTSAPKP